LKGGDFQEAGCEGPPYVWVPKKAQ
jgi:hypothetical protein